MVRLERGGRLIKTWWAALLHMRSTYMGTITYTRPTKTTIEVNDTPEVREMAKELGWVEAKAKSRPKPKTKAKPKAKS